MLDEIKLIDGVRCVVVNNTAIVSGLGLLLGLELLEEPDLDAADPLLELVDILPTVLTTVGVVLMFGALKRQRRDHARLARDLETARAMGHWCRNEARVHLEGLGAAIDRQFTQWRLTAAEREVALLLLKGLSHKKIEQRTDRPQACAGDRRQGGSHRTRRPLRLFPRGSAPPPRRRRRGVDPGGRPPTVSNR